MAEVTVRDAQRDDAGAIAQVWAAASPLLVRSAARAAYDLGEDGRLGRRRWVAVARGEVVGTATSVATGPDTARVAVEVHPGHGSSGIGTALMRAVFASVPQAHELTAVCADDPIALSFAVRHGFLPTGEHRVSAVAPATVPRVGSPPPGLTPVRLEALADLGALLDTHNRAAADDPSGLSHPYTREEFRADWWDNPDNAPELSWALVGASGGEPVVAAFTSVQVDHARSRAWSAMTATRSEHRGRGLARWVKQRMLNDLRAAGVTEALTGNDVSNAAMLAVNDGLGYRPRARTVRVERRLPH